MLNEIIPYFFYSQYNSIRMAKSVVRSVNQPKTVTNTLSYQEDGINTKDFFQLYQFNDAVRNQFKSTYSNHEIKLFGCDGSVKSIGAYKRTNNLNIEDYRTANYISVDGVLVVFFGSGQILEEGSNNIISDYNLGQFVPAWLKEGRNIEIDTYGSNEIEKIVWLEDYQVYGLKTYILYSNTASQSTKIKSVYNKFDYDIYEFDIDFSELNEGKYQLQISATDDNFEDVVYLSERLYIKEIHEKTHHIICEIDKNNQINYSWGIQHMMRLERLKELKYNPSGENNIHKTDDNTFLLSATNFEEYEAELKPVPTAMAIKITMALSSTILFVDTRSYVSDSKPNTEKLGSSNLYHIKQKLTLSNLEYIDNTVDFANNFIATLLQDSEGLIIRDDNILSFLIAE